MAQTLALAVSSHVHPAMTNPSNKPLKKIRRLRYRCNHPGCGKPFERKYNLKCHVRIHSNEKPYNCIFPHCKRTFRWKSSLNHHLMSVAHIADVERAAFSGSPLLPVRLADLVKKRSTQNLAVQAAHQSQSTGLMPNLVTTSHNAPEKRVMGSQIVPRMMIPLQRPTAAQFPKFSNAVGNTLATHHAEATTVPLSGPFSKIYDSPVSVMTRISEQASKGAKARTLQSQEAESSSSSPSQSLPELLNTMQIDQSLAEFLELGPSTEAIGSDSQQGRYRPNGPSLDLDGDLEELTSQLSEATSTASMQMDSTSVPDFNISLLF